MEAYGYAAGILLLDEYVPYIPGDVGNAKTFKYPVMYRKIEGLTGREIRENAAAWTDKVVAAAVEMEEQGVRGISASAGSMIAFQDAVAQAVKIPVCLSSFLQLPWISASIDPSKAIGLITGDSRTFNNSILEKFGIKVDNKIVVAGLEKQPAFKAAVHQQKGKLDSGKVEKEVVKTAKAMVKKNPKVGAILITSGPLCPYTKAVQDAVGVPIFDVVSMIDFMTSATLQDPPKGFY